DDPLRVIANDASDWLLERAAPFVPDSSGDFSVALQVANAQVYSDHASFWANGYSAVQISETIDITTNPLHTLGDTLGHLDFDFAENAVKLIASLTHDLAGPFELAAPALSAANDGLDVVLSWNEVPGAAAYTIERNGVLIAELGGDAREYRDAGACCGERDYTITASTGALRSEAASATIVSIPESMAPYPNPSTGGGVFIPYQSASPTKIARLGSAVRVSIYAPSGRLVRVLTAERQDAWRVGVLEWNGRDSGGESVAAGVYLIKIDNGDTEQTRKITLVR
ncbi:MAG: T9SS type A sorting domain-containing protein, partial [Gemmatimonadetes bacterium]|nr:T9SS type A sorting domain-containing protein [Gemmatimonadota bacterium]